MARRQKSIYDGLESSGRGQTEKAAALLLQANVPDALQYDLIETHYELNPDNARDLSYYDIRREVRRFGARPRTQYVDPTQPQPRYTNGQLAAGKQCRTCGEVRPRTPSFYHLNKYSRDGYRASCKPCEKRKRFKR